MKANVLVYENGNETPVWAIPRHSFYTAVYLYIVKHLGTYSNADAIAKADDVIAFAKERGVYDTVKGQWERGERELGIDTRFLYSRLPESGVFGQ